MAALPVKAWFLTGIAIVALALAWSALTNRPKDLSGGIVLSALSCDQSVDNVTVSGRATNQTNQRLSGVTVEYAAGAGGLHLAAQEKVNTFQRGGALDLHHSFKSTAEVNSCSIKFYRNGTQLPAAFRP